MHTGTVYAADWLGAACKKLHRSKQRVLVHGEVAVICKEEACVACTNCAPILHEMLLGSLQRWRGRDIVDADGKAAVADEACAELCQPIHALRRRLRRKVGVQHLRTDCG